MVKSFSLMFGTIYPDIDCEKSLISAETKVVQDYSSFKKLPVKETTAFQNFYSLSFSSYLYQVRGRHCEKRARRYYLQFNMN